VQITITAREAFDKNIWIQLCDITGINEWAINEGLMDDDEAITLTEEEARQLHLI